METVMDDEIVTVPAGDLEPSNLFWIKVGDLKFNSWHPQPRRSWLRKVSPEFSEENLGPLFVNQRQDLALVCFDGRARAALVRDLFGPDEELLCRVWPHDDPKKLAELATRFPGDPEAESRWEAAMYSRANAGEGRTRAEREGNRKAMFMEDDMLSIHAFLRKFRRERERLRDAVGGIGPVLVDRLVPGYAIGDPYYLRWEDDLMEW
jgi:hypothetical protein